MKDQSLINKLNIRFGEEVLHWQDTADDIPTLWVAKDQAAAVCQDLKNDSELAFSMLYDLTAIDERQRQNRQGQPDSEFTLVYHLLSFQNNADVRIKVPLNDRDEISTVQDIWPAANWYEREVFDMFGLRFSGHPDLRRILMPSSWAGHPLRKEHAARATELEPFSLPDDKWEEEEEHLRYNPEQWGMKRSSEDSEFMFLNLGPQHPGTHGLLRLVLQLEGENILDVVPDIGFHHRGAEKMGERQTWHTYIPYTDRVDYLSGVLNNLPYVMAVEQLAGIKVPDRAKVIRIMMSELFRIISHLVYYGTFAQDVGALSPVFYMFTDREKAFKIVEAVCGARMHPNWFRIGGVAQDLPKGWERLVKEFVDYLPKRLRTYDKMVMKNKIFKNRTEGIGVYTTQEAIEWGVTGPGLRATGMEWDFRKMRPYSGYEQFDFEIPTGTNGDCYDRTMVRIEEMRQSLRIIEQCMNNMPPGDYKSDHQLATPPKKDGTMKDIETLINHFLGVSWGPVIPPGESFVGVEGAKGNNGYYLVSDGNTTSYRTRVRAPSFPHIQMVPYISKGYTIPDLLAILGSVDYVLADVDR
ncbi:MAG: NADH-quinone oxidoreductase subunit C/D [Bacteroidales bacterium]|nr:NADH-quinone oxidoreductase subunit C/D [Bacteroidales bacterium]